MKENKDGSATAKFQQVLLKNRVHVEALNNYGIVLLKKSQKSLYPYAVSIFEDCVHLDATK